MTKQIKNSGSQPLNFRPSDRRSFLKTGAMMGTALIATPAFSATGEAEIATTGHPVSTPFKVTKQRTLGSGKYSLEVSALGLGYMGMSYHRGRVPDRDEPLRFISGVDPLRHVNLRAMAISPPSKKQHLKEKDGVEKY